MKGIRLHPEHGLNPTMSVCILCGKEKGEIALLGAGYKAEAPMKMVVDVEPCKECREKYLSVGVMLVEANQVPVGNRGRKKIVPTGGVMVLREEAFKRIVNVEVPEDRIVYFEKKVFQELLAMKED